MAIFNVITFFIHAIAGAIASLLKAVFTHLVPALIAAGAVVGLTVAFCTSCGIGGLAFLRRRKRENQ